MARLRTSALLATALTLVSISNAAEIAFSDQTNASGVVSNHNGGPTHSFLAGGVVGDFNRDGFQDIFHPAGGASPDKLYINNGDGTFTDRAEAWGVAVTHFGTGAAVADYDGDGWMDIFVTSSGEGVPSVGKHRLYRNLGGSAFIDMAEDAGVNLASVSSPDAWGGAFGDYDLDGDLDLAVAAWHSSANGNRLFANNGDGTFTDVTVAAGLTALNSNRGFSPRLVDMDGDRYPELIWIGDFGSSQYFINNTDGTFTNFTGGSNTSQGSTEMGQTVADINHDGLFDFYVTTIGDNKLYINDGDHHYTDRAAQAGVVITGWGWATAAADVDNDSLIDLFATSQTNTQYLYHNQSTNGGADLNFNEIAMQVGLISSVSGRGLSNFDYDNDGDQDVIIFPRNGPVKLFRNDLQSAGDAHWLRVFLDTGGSSTIPPNGIGSVVQAVMGEEVYLNRVDGGSNYLSQSEVAAHFGTSTIATVDQIIVEWTDGSITTVDDVAADQIITVTPDGLLYGDADGNGIVNLTDFAKYVDCVTGPGEFDLLGCSAFDTDGDHDVDFADLGRMMLNVESQ